MPLLGIISDTHVPDRAAALPFTALNVFTTRQVDQILHVGDISQPNVLAQLSEIAPVLAVRGNRDFFSSSDLPMHRTLQIEDVTIGMTHGHMNWPVYFIKRILVEFFGPPAFSKLESKVIKKFPHTDVVLFGHHHVPVNRRVGKQLLFNPGSPTWPNPTQPHLKPSVGLLTIQADQVSGEIVFLE